jgi:exopolysaccharide biosynthesis protein
VSLGPQADSLERTAPSFSAARHPRSAIGTSEGGRILWLIAVDGRQTASVGMTLVELADLMRELGITEGLNLDGGGSTALWVGGQVRNRPSDPTGERPVGNAVMIVRDGPRPLAPRSGRRP